jgi:hypothetical protein
MRRIIANLDFEQYLAAAGALSKAAAARIAPLGTLLRVFAAEGDRLWTPTPVAAAALPDDDPLPRPVLESGPLDALPPADAVLAWGEGASLPAGGGASWPCGADVPLHEHVWNLPRCGPELARAANDRRFCLRLAREFLCALPGAEFVADRGELDRALAAAVSKNQQRFVLKAPFSASGRARLIFARDEVPSDAFRKRVDTLFTRYGGALLEPWMERTADFGALGLIDDRGVAFLGLHRQHVTPEGGFVGISVRPFAVPDGVSKEDLAALTVAARRVGETLLEFGYRGPYSVDSWRYRDAAGERIQPIGEINARMTMGLVTRAAAERVYGRECIDEVELRIDGPPREGEIVLLAQPRVTLFRIPVE